jgi:hypothetical protein
MAQLSLQIANVIKNEYGKFLIYINEQIEEVGSGKIKVQDAITRIEVYGAQRALLVGICYYAIRMHNCNLTRDLFLKSKENNAGFINPMTPYALKMRKYLSIVDSFPESKEQELTLWSSSIQARYNALLEFIEINTPLK